jgi:hypothetical protein
MSQLSSQDNPDEASGERPGPPSEFLDESLAKLQALINEAGALAERYAARRG